MKDDPTVFDGLPPLDPKLTIGEMIHMVNRKEAEIRQLNRAIAERDPRLEWLRRLAQR